MKVKTQAKMIELNIDRMDRRIGKWKEEGLDRKRNVGRN